MNYQYYKVRKDRQDWLGMRFFRVKVSDHEATCICFSVGETRKGKGNSTGIHTLSKITLFSNYLAMDYCDQIKKSDWDKAFKKIIEVLK